MAVFEAAWQACTCSGCPISSTIIHRNMALDYTSKVKLSRCQGETGGANVWMIYLRKCSLDLHKMVRCPLFSAYSVWPVTVCDVVGRCQYWSVGLQESWRTSVFHREEVMSSEGRQYMVCRRLTDVESLFSAGVRQADCFCFKARNSKKASAVHRPRASVIPLFSASFYLSLWLKTKRSDTHRGAFIKIEQCNEMSELNKINEVTKFCAPPAFIIRTQEAQLGSESYFKVDVWTSLAYKLKFVLW